MNLLFFLLGELQSSAALVPILGLFIIRSFLVPTDAICQDSDKDCPQWAYKSVHGCDQWLKMACPFSCSICHVEPESSTEPMISSFLSFSEYSSVCSSVNKHCSLWTGLGECERNPYFMAANCCDECGTPGSG